MAGLVIVEVFSTQRADRNQPVGASLVQLDEQAGAGDAGNAALKSRADPVDEMMGDQAVGSLAFGLHSPPLGDGNLGCDFAQMFCRLAIRQRAFAEAQGADQSAVHDEVRIAADRRGEMRIATEIEAEMAV